jgi:hypothetical protein
LNKAPAKQKEFSDPLKEGILAVRQGLRVQDKPREKREDELKMSILNARKGLKRATSQEGTTETKKESVGSWGRGGREGTPEVEDEVHVKVEEVTPKKTIEVEEMEEPLRLVKSEGSTSSSKPIERVVSKWGTKPGEKTLPSKVTVSPKSTPAETNEKSKQSPSIFDATESVASKVETKPVEKTSPSKVTVAPKSTPTETKPTRTVSVSKPPSLTKPKPAEVSPPKSTTTPKSPPVSTKDKLSPSKLTTTPKSPPLSTKPSKEKVSPSKLMTTPKSPLLSKPSSISPPKSTTTPSVQKKEVDPTFKTIAKVETPRKEDDSPTPRKKFPKSETPEKPSVESPAKSLDPVKQKSLPTPPKEMDGKGIPPFTKILMRFNCKSV